MSKRLVERASGSPIGVQDRTVNGITPRPGLVRATEDIDLLIARDRANQTLVKQAMEILPDRAIRELGGEDLAQWIVVRVNDDITVDLMTEACGVRFEEAAGGVETEVIDSVPIPFAGAELMLRMKQSGREKDAADRSFLEQLIRARRAKRHHKGPDKADPAAIAATRPR